MNIDDENKYVEEYMGKYNIEFEDMFNAMVKYHEFQLSVTDVSKLVEKYNLPIKKEDYKKYKKIGDIIEYAPITRVMRSIIVIDLVRYGEKIII